MEKFTGFLVHCINFRSGCYDTLDFNLDELPKQNLIPIRQTVSRTLELKISQLHIHRNVFLRNHSLLYVLNHKEKSE